MARGYRHWTFKEIEFLKKNYNKMTMKELAQELNRSYGSIVGKVNDLELKKDRHTLYAVYENGEKTMIGTADELAKRLGVKKRTFQDYATPSYRKDKNRRRYAKKL